MSDKIAKAKFVRKSRAGDEARLANIRDMLAKGTTRSKTPRTLEPAEIDALKAERDSLVAKLPRSRFASENVRMHVSSEGDRVCDTVSRYGQQHSQRLGKLEEQNKRILDALECTDDGFTSDVDPGMTERECSAKIRECRAATRRHHTKTAKLFAVKDGLKQAAEKTRQDSEAAALEQQAAIAAADHAESEVVLAQAKQKEAADLKFVTERSLRLAELSLDERQALRVQAEKELAVLKEENLKFVAKNRLERITAERLAEENEQTELSEQKAKRLQDTRQQAQVKRRRGASAAVQAPGDATDKAGIGVPANADEVAAGDAGASGSGDGAPLQVSSHFNCSCGRQYASLPSFRTHLAKQAKEEGACFGASCFRKPGYLSWLAYVLSVRSEGSQYTDRGDEVNLKAFCHYVGNHTSEVQASEKDVNWLKSSTFEKLWAAEKSTSKFQQLGPTNPADSQQYQDHYKDFVQQLDAAKKAAAEGTAANVQQFVANLAATAESEGDTSSSEQEEVPLLPAEDDDGDDAKVAGKDSAAGDEDEEEE